MVSTLDALKDLVEQLENIDVWWIGVPNKGGVDLTRARQAIKDQEDQEDHLW